MGKENRQRWYMRLEKFQNSSLTSRFCVLYYRDIKENTLRRRVDRGTLQREVHMLEASYREAVEDYL